MLTVLFATHNGSATLPLMLEAFTHLVTPCDWEIIAVDNCSTDNTREVLESFRDRLPLQIYDQPRRGKNAALNMGVEHVRGDLVILTDDDVIPTRDWLVCYHGCESANPEYDVFAGPILPHWGADPDPVVLRNAPLTVTYALTRADWKEGPIAHDRVWGPNMAVRRRVFDAGHRFDEIRGPAAGNYIMGSESEFTQRLHSAGHLSWFCASARVQHIIRAHQVAPAWVIARAYRYGRFVWYRDREHQHLEPSIAGIPRRVYRRALGAIARWFRATLSGDEDRKFRSAWEMQYLRGYIGEGITSLRTQVTSGLTESRFVSGKRAGERELPTEAEKGQAQAIQQPARDSIPARGDSDDK
jgi:glycosyltransferase involved in cell wall biosynthesis